MVGSHGIWKRRRAGAVQTCLRHQGPHKRHHISRSSKKGLWVYLLIFNCFDQVTSKRQLQEGERGFILDHSWRRHHPSRRGGAWLQHREAAGHTVSVVRKQREQSVTSGTPPSHETLPPKGSTAFQNGTTWQWANYSNTWTHKGHFTFTSQRFLDKNLHSNLRPWHYPTQVKTLEEFAKLWELKE